MNLPEQVETDRLGPKVKHPIGRMTGEGIGDDLAVLKVKKARLEFRAKFAPHNYLVLFFFLQPNHF